MAGPVYFALVFAAGFALGVVRVLLELFAAMPALLARGKSFGR